MKPNKPSILNFILLLALMLYAISSTPSSAQPKLAADEKTPSYSYYFDWISNQYEGTTESQALKNLAFFQWMHDTYGMKLDIYSLDVGNMDDGPYTAGVGRLIPFHYGNLQSRSYKEQFPNGFGPLAKAAEGFGARLGLWLGPGGYGDTPESQAARKEMMVSMTRDHNFLLFKLDAVAGQFDKAEEDLLIETLIECRKYAPDLLVSNMRIDFGKVSPYVSHDLWAGVETYVDVFINNSNTATHHRAGAYDRAFTPNMSRLYEDHGVCFSSCLDYWDDELILQAFNRSLIMAPQIYGNPWFLRDDEFPKLAKIFNLHRKYKKILVEGLPLDSVQYGPYAMSRGNEKVRFITLRNNSWNSVDYIIDCNESIGLSKMKKVSIRLFHPWDQELGQVRWGAKKKITVLPFRTALVAVGEPLNEPVLEKFTLPKGEWHYQLPAMTDVPVPDFAEGIFEACCFAGDNNALEVRSLERAGKSEVEVVEACRTEFTSKPYFVNLAIWDRNLFDNDLNTFFQARLDDRLLRVDLGEVVNIDELIIHIRDRQMIELNEKLERFGENAYAEVSTDMINWKKVVLDYQGKGTIGRIRCASAGPIQFIRIHEAPRRIAEIKGYIGQDELDRDNWRVSNLFMDYKNQPAVKAWKTQLKPEELNDKSYLCVAVNGQHGHEKVYAALRINGQLVGAPDRAVSYDSNTWEYFNVETDNNYTYFFPMKDKYIGKEIEVWLILLDGGTPEIKPETWMTARIN